MAEKANNQTGPNHSSHHPPLPCPRCNSSNTKFCYYNNYSLSQPRHFCKACKRYWTRGGTLRNVPVGGGCRKNKRMKRPPPPSAAGSAAASNRKMDLSPVPNHAISNNNSNNRLFYNPLEPIDFPFSSYSSVRVSSDNHNSSNNTGFDFQPQMISGVGLGFSSSGQISSTAGDHDSIFFGSSAFASSSTMASLLASSFHHQKFGAMNQPANGVSGFMPYVESENGSVMGKDVKFDGGENRFGWNPNPNPSPNPNPIEQMNSPDPSSLTWNPTNLGAWFEQASNSNMGSSVPSLI